MRRFCSISHSSKISKRTRTVQTFLESSLKALQFRFYVFFLKNAPKRSYAGEEFDM